MIEYSQKTINIPEYLDPPSVLGSKDSFFNQVRQDTDLRMSANNGGTEISLYGHPEEVERITNVFSKMIEILDSGSYLDSEIVDLILRQSKNNNLLFEREADTILKIGNKEVKTKTIHQKEYLESMRNNLLTFAIGAAGTGKSMVAASYALQALKNKEVDEIVLVRPPVALAGYDLGFIPGTKEEKAMPWIAPIMNVFNKFLSPEKLLNYIETERIKLLNIAYARGYSFENAFIIVDEAQLIPTEVFKALITRIGKNCKMVICGDTKQTENNIRSGLETAARIMEPSLDVGIVRFDHSDCVRSGICAYAIKAFEDAGY